MLRKIRIAAAILGLAVMITGFAVAAASAANCHWVCPKPYICRLVCD